MDVDVVFLVVGFVVGVVDSVVVEVFTVDSGGEVETMSVELWTVEDGLGDEAVDVGRPPVRGLILTSAQP